MCSCHQSEQTDHLSTTSASPCDPSPVAPVRVPSPYNSIPYNRVSALMDVDFFRGSMNIDGVSQNGYLEMLRVVNPDPSSRSNSELSETMSAARANTPVDVISPPRLPDLYFVSSPEPSLSCVMDLSYHILANLLREGMMPPRERSVRSFNRTESPPRGTHSLSSLDESPVPSIARIVTWNTVPQELFFAPLGPGSDCRQPVDRCSCRSSNRLTSTTVTLSSDGRSTSFASSLESLFDLVDRFNRQGARNGRPGSDRTSKSSARISAASSSVSSSNRKLSWSWGLFLSVDSLPTMPLVLAAANIAQKRRLPRRFVRRPLS